ncbi:TKL protein kinase, variant [Phytophthora nicotianae CJ01A1]|uniref:TKL protein kinase, variant n=3 Tax=Phytophthora nicotianae TaxID=4792 RepID=W2WHN8_PHYNI|nr:TKL protein kinase, variant [Phytophthora nicotianae]ETP09633.1 TKL protein kinase, variant [Phytophthora nicotianae CJ01A1]
MYRFTSIYQDSSCDGAPSGVFVQQKNDCKNQVASSGSRCAAVYDDTNNRVGYVNEMCHEGRREEGFIELFGTQPFMAYDYYRGSDCSTYENSVAYQLAGECMTLYDGYSPFGSGTISISDGFVLCMSNKGNTSSSALNCPGASGLDYIDIEIPVSEINRCYNAPNVDGAFVFYNRISTVESSSSSSGSSITYSSIGSGLDVGSEEEFSSSGNGSVFGGFNSGSTATNPLGSRSRSDSSSNERGLDVGSTVVVTIGAVVVVVIIICITCVFLRVLQGKNLTSRSSSQDALHRNGTAGTDSPTDGSTRDSNLWDDDAIIATRIPRDQIIIGTMISRGGFGEVYRGQYNNQDVAVKMLFSEMRKDLKKGGDLRALLKEFEARKHPQGIDDSKICIASHIAQALTYMHSLSPVVIHRDLKSKNVLLTEDLEAKITDFGASKEQQDQTMTAGVGTMLWMAPEVMMAKRYSEKADIFSFGVLLSELDLHTLPYSHARIDPETGMKLPDAVLIQKVASGDLRITFSPYCLDSIVKLAEECVALDPAARPGAPMVMFRLQTIVKESSSEGYLS